MRKADHSTRTSWTARSTSPRAQAGLRAVMGRNAYPPGTFSFWWGCGVAESRDVEVSYRGGFFCIKAKKVATFFADEQK